MREIKFRGKSDGVWCYGSHVKTGVGLHYIIPQNLISNALFQTVVDGATVGQYTGLKDKNGREIYEGDVVAEMVCQRTVIDGMPKDYPPKKVHFRIGWGEEGCWKKLKGLGDEVGDLCGFFTLKNECEVVGNIHDNPELLGDNQ